MPSAPAANALERLRGNVMGGITAAVLSVPTCVGFGILALAPLGAEFIQHGVLAGLYAAVGGILQASCRLIVCIQAAFLSSTGCSFRLRSLPTC